MKMGGAIRQLASRAARRLRRFSARQEAATMVEYAILAVAIAVASIVAVQALSDSIGGSFINHQDSVTEEMQGGPSSP
jgi:Flp pilus assembly pilin Flp